MVTPRPFLFFLPIFIHLTKNQTNGVCGVDRRTTMGGSSSREQKEVEQVEQAFDDDSFADAMRLHLQRLIFYARSADTLLQREVAERLANEAVKRERTHAHAAPPGLILPTLTRRTPRSLHRQPIVSSRSWSWKGSACCCL